MIPTHRRREEENQKRLPRRGSFAAQCRRQDEAVGRGREGFAQQRTMQMHRHRAWKAQVLGPGPQCQGYVWERQEEKRWDRWAGDR